MFQSKRMIEYNWFGIWSSRTLEIFVIMLSFNVEGVEENVVGLIIRGKKEYEYIFIIIIII